MDNLVIFEKNHPAISGHISKPGAAPSSDTTVRRISFFQSDLCIGQHQTVIPPWLMRLVRLKLATYAKHSFSRGQRVFPGRGPLEARSTKAPWSTMLRTVGSGESSSLCATRSMGVPSKRSKALARFPSISRHTSRNHAGGTMSLSTKMRTQTEGSFSPVSTPSASPTCGIRLWAIV